MMKLKIYTAGALILLITGLLTVSGLEESSTDAENGKAGSIVTEDSAGSESAEKENTKRLTAVLTEMLRYTGESLQTVKNEKGEPDTTGDFEGGPYYVFGDVTLFLPYGGDIIVAAAVRAEKLDEKDLEWLSEVVKEAPVVSEMNKRDGFWMDLYELTTFDVMIEKTSREGEVVFVWVTEPGLFK